MAGAMVPTPSVQAPAAWARANNGFRNRITPREQAAGLTPADLTFGYDPGDFRRYGADPTGASPSDTALANACKSNTVVYDGHPEGGYYTFTTGFKPVAYPLSIRGAALSYGSLTGTIFELAASAGSGAILLEWEAEAYGFRCSGITFRAEDGTLGQVLVKFSNEWRGGRISDCLFTTPSQGSDNDTIGVWLTGAGTFSGNILINGNQFSNLLFNIFCAGSVTSLRIRDNDLYGNTAAENGAAVVLGEDTVGVLVSGNYFDGWNQTGCRGITSQGVRNRFINNVFELCTVPYAFVNGGSPIQGYASGNVFITSGSPIYPQNGTDLCIISDSGFTDYDSSQFSSIAGFKERGRAAGVGEYIAPAFAAGNFVGTGAMTWTVASGDVQEYKYAVVGKKMHLSAYIITSDIGGTPNTTLRIAIPDSYTAKGSRRAPCLVQNNGTWQSGMCLIVNGAGYVEIYADPTGGNNWSASAGNAGVGLDVTFEVN
jgi:hypothetical protein